LLIKHWEVNEDESNVIEGSLKIITGKTEYRISENGKIRKSEVLVKKQTKNKITSDCAHPIFFTFKNCKKILC